MYFIRMIYSNWKVNNHKVLAHELTNQKVEYSTVCRLMQIVLIGIAFIYGAGV